MLFKHTNWKYLIFRQNFPTPKIPDMCTRYIINVSKYLNCHIYALDFILHNTFEMIYTWEGQYKSDLGGQYKSDLGGQEIQAVHWSNYPASLKSFHES
jgi:hypothetical protein